MIDGYKDNWYALLICVLKKKSAAEAGAIMKLCGYKKLLRENRGLRWKEFDEEMEE